MPTQSLPRRILAGFAASLLFAACIGPDYGSCDLGGCKTQNFEVGFYDSLWRRIDTLGSYGLSIVFTQRRPLAKTSVTALSCATCEDFILMDSAVLIADRPIVSPEGDTIPAGSNLIDQPWKNMLGRVGYNTYFIFRPGVRFESGRHTFAVTAPLQYDKTRRILSDTSYLTVP